MGALAAPRRTAWRLVPAGLLLTALGCGRQSDEDAAAGTAARARELALERRLATAERQLSELTARGAVDVQRVAVARALVRDPDILLADHPTSDQDPAGAELVCRAFDRAAARGAACVVFGRDPMLRVHAEALGWSQWHLCDGRLAPLHTEAELQGDWAMPIDAFASAGSAPGAKAQGDDGESFANVVPFPSLARSAGAR